VVYVVLEGEAGFKLRAAAWETHNCRPLPAGLHLVLQPFTLTQPQDVADLAAAAKTAGDGAVIVIDTLNRAAPTADENSSKDMGQILEAAKALQAITGGLVVLVHHTGKDASRGLRGHSSLFAAMDAAVEVSRAGDIRAWQVAKSKDGQDGQEKGFRLEVIAMGTDDDGEDITSCVVVPTDTPARQHKPLTASQRQAMDALNAALADDLFGTSVHLDVWREAFYVRMGDAAASTKRQAFGRVTKELADQGRVYKVNGMFSVSDF
jgi:putative DNA primase/helicase